VTVRESRYASVDDRNHGVNTFEQAEAQLEASFRAAGLIRFERLCRRCLLPPCR
jgi:hypothetical protein